MHLWKGIEIDDLSLMEYLEKLDSEMSNSLKQNLPVKLVLRTLDKFNQSLSDEQLSEYLIDANLSKEDLKDEIEFLRNFLKMSNLKNKIKKELGGYDFWDLKKNMDSADVFEGKRPLGIILHITPSNSNVLAFLAALEGLLSGNVNILKISSKDSSFSLKALKILGELDDTGFIKNHLMVLSLNSKQKNILIKLASVAGGVSVWGGDPAVMDIKNMVPAQCKVITWGHKISFAYITKPFFHDEETLCNLAKDCVRLEQQACASPQCVYLETDSYEVVKQFAKEFYQYLKSESDPKINGALSADTQAEITNVTEMVKLDEVMIDSLVLEDPDKKFRIFVENDSTLKTSPLNRTIWIKPLPKDHILSELFKFRNHLQTIGFAGNFKDSSDVLNVLLKTGATRIKPVGTMLDTYEGEAHDGIYPLHAFTKNVSTIINGLEGWSRINFSNYFNQSLSTKVMTKDDFQKQSHDLQYAKLFFKSGGSSGKTALSSFNYADYNLLMEAASEGLVASGLDPRRDKVINLFFGGGLYGGMISFFTILEKMQAIQYSMGAWPNFEFVGETIISNNIDTLIGMTSYLMQLLDYNREKFKKYNGIKKIFYGGEHFTNNQKEWVQKEFNIHLIKSASYGSVDAGPLGYQCPYTLGSVHHLHDSIHHLEILKLDQDTPVEDHEIGRLVFTTPDRESVVINRYEIGDIGRWIPGICACGRKAKMFELKGRLGDVFKAGGTFINFQIIENILSEKCAYSGQLQIEIMKTERLDHLIVKLDKSKIISSDVEKIILKNYKDLSETVEAEQTLKLEVKKIDSKEFLKTPSSGKLIRVIDQRKD